MFTFTKLHNANDSYRQCGLRYTLFLTQMKTACCIVISEL